MPGLRTASGGLSVVAHTVVEDWVNAVAFAPGGDQVVAATADGTVTALREDGTTQLVHRHDGPATSVAISTRGQIASGGHDGHAILDGTICATNARGWVDRVSWRPDGELLAAASGRQVHTFGRDGTPVATSEAMDATVSCLGWHPRGVQLAVGGYGGVRLLRGKDLRQETHLQWTGSALELRISPDGRRLAHGNQDASVHFWDLRRRTELEMLGYQTKVRQLDWRHDGQLLAIGGGEDITIWDFAGRGPAGSRPLTLQGHQRLITWLGFAPRLHASGQRRRRRTRPAVDARHDPPSSRRLRAR